MDLERDIIYILQKTILHKNTLFGWEIPFNIIERQGYVSWS